jgi:hypothetical protein
MSTSYEGEVPQDVPPTIPFVLLFKDHSGHVRTLQENKKFVENVSHESEVANREFTYTITIPREEEYFPVVRYKCDTSLRPVPIVSICLSSFALCTLFSFLLVKFSYQSIPPLFSPFHISSVFKLVFVLKESFVVSPSRSVPTLKIPPI